MPRFVIITEKCVRLSDGLQKLSACAAIVSVIPGTGLGTDIYQVAYDLRNAVVTLALYSSTYTRHVRGSVQMLVWVPWTAAASFPTVVAVLIEGLSV